MSRPSLDAGHNVSHRSVEGSVAVSLGRDAASTSTATADGQDPLSILRFFDVVLVVDDSGSMHVTEDSEDGRSRWDEARVALEGVAATVARYDSDGMDIAFLNSEAEGRGISSPAEVRKLFDSVEPNGQTPTGERLAMLFMEYWDILDSWSDKKKAGKLTADDTPPKKRNYIVLTDGRPSDDLASVIVQCARRLDEGAYPLSQLNVQFIQVGADVEATKALRELDSDLGEPNEVRDIVDILAYSGGNLQAEDIMHQLHGGIFKRSKGIEEEAAYVRELVQDTPAAAAVVAKGILTEEEAQATPEESAPVSEPTSLEEEDDEAETIPVTADGVPSSHPDAAKLNEGLPQSDAAARAADEAGLGTALGAGLADLAPTARVEPEANNMIVDAEPHQDEAENNTSEPDSEAADPRPQTAIFTQQGAHASELEETTSATVEAMEGTRTFSLLGKNLKLDTEEDAKPYCDELAAIDGLEEVHLGGNTLGQGACEAFAKALQSSRSTLRVFDGADIFTGRLITEIPASLKALCDGLVNHEKLEEVDLSDNAFGGRCADAMTELFSNNHSIEVIRLQNNGLGISGGKIIAAALEAAADQLEASGATSRLRSVTIGRNRLENGSAPDLARALARHGKSIEEVRVPQNGIRMQGIEELCQQLAANCPNLRSLDLQDNTLVQRGSRALSAAIPSWPQLESLNLSDSIVRSTGAKWIFETLAEHSSDLHTLLLQYCELNRGALASLADALEALPNLKKVELHGNWAEEDDDFIERIKTTVEARGGSVEALGLDELELEAEEEEEPEEDYEDSEEEEEEEEEEEVAEAESKEGGDVPVLTHDTQAVPAETQSPDQTEGEALVPTADETEVISADTPAVKASIPPATEDTNDGTIVGAAAAAVTALGAAVGAVSLEDHQKDDLPVSARDVASTVAEDLPVAEAESRIASSADVASASAPGPASVPAPEPESSRTFSLLGKNLKLDTEEDAKPYCDELAAIDGLEEIHLGGNTLGQGACEAFARALQSSRSTLRVFDGADIFTGRLITEIPASLKALCDGLVNHEKLEEVDLSDNAFGGRCADAMTELFSNNHSIEVIRLQNNGLGISGGKIIAAALEAAADQHEASGATSRLRSVTIGRNRLENGSAPDLARALARHGKSIEEVRVPQNGIRMQGIEELCQQLAANCPNLRSLDLQDNTLVQRGSRALSAAIPSWPRLESLNLSDSIVRSTGAKWIFETLAEHSSDLHTLLLQYCELNRGALTSLADALEALPNLKKVELHGNWAEEDDDFIERIRSTIEARGGSVEGLGLDELELEAEEEEEPEEDYEDSEEEEEEDAEEEVAEQGSKEGGDVPVLTHDRQVASAESQSPDQTEGESLAPTADETEVISADTPAVKASITPATENTDDGTIAGAAAAAVTALGAAVGAVSLEDDQINDLEGSERDVSSAVAEDVQPAEAEPTPASSTEVVSTSAPGPASVPAPEPEPESSRTFSLLGKNLKLDTEEDAKPYCDELAAIDGLEEIHLGGNTLGQGACEAFARALQSSRSTLRVFDGADIFTGRLITEIPASLKALCDGLVNHEKLEEVDLSDNAFGGRCADAMTELFSNNHSIEVIRLQNNGLGISGGKIIAAALEAAADQNEAAGVASRLRSVTIGRNRLENGSAPDLARALARHGKSIEEVRVPQNGIRMQGIEELCQQLAANCPNLRSLDLQDNTLVQRGSRALSAAIPSWPQLESLNLSDSIVRSTGAKWIFETLAEHSSDLHTLLLQYCELNRGALTSLADALEALPNLKKVELHGNWAKEDDDFIKRIKTTVEARGGSVEGLGLEELELEAEEEEEPEEDYEDSEEEEEEEAEEEEVADEESKEGAKILVLTHDRQVASAESEPPRQTEVGVPAPTADETEEEQPQIVSPDTSAVEPSPEPEMNGAHEDVVEVETVEHASSQSISRSKTNAEDNHAPVSEQSEEESLPDAKITEASSDVTSEDNRDIEASAQSTGGIAGVALGTVAALERAVNAVSLSDHSEDASTREAAAAPEELAHHDRDMQPVADAPTPSALPGVDETSIEQPAEEDHQPSIESHSKAAVHHEADAEEPSEHPGLDATAAAVAVPAEIVDVSVQAASATGSVIQEKAEEKVSEVAPNVALGLPLDEVATAAGAPPTEAQTEPKREEVSSKPVTTMLEQALEGAKSLIPDMSGGHIESSGSVSGEGFALGESVDDPDADVDAKAETGTRGNSTVSRSGGIFNAIKSATGNVSLLSSRPRGGVSGEGLDSSALPTPAVEAPSSSGPQLSAASEGNGAGEGLPQSDSQTLTSKLQEALDDELPRRNGRGRHGRNSSIDLSGELYIDGDLSESRFEEHERQQGGPSLTNRFYAAFGAVLELMR